MIEAAPSNSPEVLTPAVIPEAPTALVAILRSKCFEKAPTLRALILYLWQHREEPISEYAIATEALGRPSHFNPKTDATVRVQISRLRQRLEKFYEDEGQHLSGRFAIPLGSHQLQLEMPAETEAIVLPAVPIQAVLPPPPRHSRWVPILASLCAVLVIVCASLTWSLVSMQSRLPAAATAPPQFWRLFFANSRPTRVILPTPVFFSWNPLGRARNASIMFRDTDVNDYDARGESNPILKLEQLYGKPSLAESYTVTSDTFAAVQLARYLDRTNLTVNFRSSASAPLEALDTENVIALGTWGTLNSLKPYLDRMSFELGAHEYLVRNRRPEGKEPEIFAVVQQSAQRAIWPGIIAVIPARSGSGHLLILGSRHTAALVSLLTSTDGLDQLTRLWRSKGSPAAYEMVIASEMDGDNFVRSWPMAFHVYKGTW